jgi:hypothetical protein
MKDKDEGGRLKDETERRSLDFEIRMKRMLTLIF